MENLVLRPKGAKKVSKIKKEVAQFRESHVVAPSTSLEPHERSLDEAVVNLLKKLKMFQDRAHDKNPIKAKAHRRLIYGLREIKRDCISLKVRAVIIARDIESYTEESELSKLVNEITEKCEENQVPLLNALKKSKLARIFDKPRSVAAVGIVDYSGAEVLFNAMISANSSRSDLFQHSFQNSLFA